MSLTFKFGLLFRGGYRHGAQVGWRLHTRNHELSSHSCRHAFLPPSPLSHPPVGVDIAVPDGGVEANVGSNGRVAGREVHVEHPASSLVGRRLRARDDGFPEAHVIVAGEHLERLKQCTPRAGGGGSSREIPRRKRRFCLNYEPFGQRTRSPITHTLVGVFVREMYPLVGKVKPN